jgi:hypothetical protein
MSIGLRADANTAAVWKAENSFSRSHTIFMGWPFCGHAGKSGGALSKPAGCSLFYERNVLLSGSRKSAATIVDYESSASRNHRRAQRLATFSRSTGGVENLCIGCRLGVDAVSIAARRDARTAATVDRCASAGDKVTFMDRFSTRKGVRR